MRRSLPWSSLAAIVWLVGSPVAGARGEPPPAEEPPPEPPEEIVLGSRSAIQPPAAQTETVLVGAGTRLYELPDRRSPLVDIAAVDAPREVLEHAEGWVRVRLRERAGWAAMAGQRTGPGIESPPDLEFLARRGEPLRPVADRLARAHALLDRPVERVTGPFTFYTDLGHPATLAFLVKLVEQLPAVYRERYGLDPWEPDRFAVVVFRAERAYREFERSDRGLAELEAAGHAAGNMAALYAEGRRRLGLGSILLHELTHLMNQSVFRGTLPPWLEEGMAEDLAFARIDPDGEIDAWRLGGERRRYFEMDQGERRHVAETWGAPATLSRLVEALRANRLPALPELLAMSRGQMARREGRALRYGQSAFLVRYLLEGAGDDGRRAFHAFLRRAAEGGSAEPDDLLGLLGGDWNQWTAGYERWLVERAAL